jgi:tetratricopeptide (TPR) repeat protein
MKKLFILAFVLLQLSVFAQKNYQEALTLANTQMTAKQYDEAIPALDKAIGFKPKIAQTYYLKAMCFFEQNKYDLSIPVFDEAIKRDGKKWQYFKRRGDAFYNTEVYEKSLSDYIKATELEPTKKNDTLFQYLADSYLKLDKFQPAIDNYNKAIALAPKNGKLYFDRGFMYFKLVKNELACLDYQKASELGMEKAKSEAYELMKCEWAKPKLRQKDNTAVEISNVEVSPFTGTIFISKNFSYSKFEITPESGGFVTGAEFAYDDKFVIKIYNPKGFKLEDGKIQTGAGFVVYDGDKELGKVEDLYGEEGGIFESEDLTNLKFTLGLNKPLELNKIYKIKVRFFDKFSNVELVAEMPLKIAEKSLKSNSINVTKSTIAQGLNTEASGDVEVKKVTLLSVGKPTNAFKSNQKNSILLSETKGLGKEVSINYSFVNKKTGVREVSGNYSSLPISAKGIEIALQNPANKGDYIIWIEVKDKQDSNKIWTMTYDLKVE